MNGALRTRGASPPVAERVEALDWTAIRQRLDDVGSSLTGPLLGAEECNAIAELFADDRRFRSTIDMSRYRFGQGRYRYFDRPLPELVADLRAAFWPHLLPMARAWAERLGDPGCHRPILSRSGTDPSNPALAASSRVGVPSST